MFGKDSFPTQLAIRLLLDSVSYSNAVPEWVDVLTINYRGRENRINKALTDYFAGAIPRIAFALIRPPL